MIYRDEYTKKLQSKQLDKSYSDEEKLCFVGGGGRNLRRERERALRDFSYEVQKFFDWWDCVLPENQYVVYSLWINRKFSPRYSVEKIDLESFILDRKSEIPIDKVLYREKKLGKLGI